MIAWVIEKENGKRTLQMRELPSLKPGRAEVKVDVYYAGINRADLLQLYGLYPQPGPPTAFEIPGLEFSGRICQIGEGVEGWKEGDPVFGLLIGGAFSTEVIVHERFLLPIYGKLSFVEAAAISESFFTAWDGLEYRAQAKENETLLISAAGSSVGLSALALANLKNLKVFGMVRSPAKKQKLLKVGAVDVFTEGQADLIDWALTRTGGKGMDIIFDLVGGERFSQYLQIAAEKGRILSLGLLGGSKTEISLIHLLRKRLMLVGSTLRARPIEEKMFLTQEFRKKILPFFIEGRLKPIIDHIFLWDQLKEALKYLEENRHFGKILLKVKEEN
ncbi:NADPH:quinone reductase [Methylacidiphilum sp. Yel]|uniref:NAD(P)H-quinone oxidoreductase n=1 Tax=Methylacidiphilum sp. Yel TaxID=1847730 RepID=UPI001069099B|nr:NAD(P)H-quinone oxidoreductase [Methylacidiphilum sp. Yel]TFE68995.1 NADPH:quinone reductase [Methylacidiphilum sp. Yel]